MSERYTDSKELTDFPPSTTTISTVAVQAGRSKVVLAVLRVSNLQLAILMGTKLNSSSYTRLTVKSLLACRHHA